jgi:hypothetical protein
MAETLEDLPNRKRSLSSPKPAEDPDQDPRLLTPSEIRALRKERKEAAEYFRKAFRERPI